MTDDPTPGAPDPYGLTQPLPVTPTVPPVAPPLPATAPVAPAHRFGNVPSYLMGRLIAAGIDLVVVAFVLATFVFHATDPTGGALPSIAAFAGRDENGFAVLAGASFVGASLLAFASEALFGTTLGKLAFGLHVRRVDGRFPGAPRAFVRALLRPLDVLVVGPLLAFVTPRHQRLGDVVAGTVVAGSRFGALAVLIGVALLGVLGYAQVAFGGGLTSAVGVSAEAANYAPDLTARALDALGIVHRAPGASPASGSVAPASADEPTTAPEPVATP
jgi:uncharacterized RDD family membrane protein YckC